MGDHFGPAEGDGQHPFIAIRPLARGLGGDSAHRLEGILHASRSDSGLEAASHVIGAPEHGPRKAPQNGFKLIFKEILKHGPRCRPIGMKGISPR